MRALRGWLIMTGLFVASSIGRAEPPARPFVFESGTTHHCFCVSRDGKKLAIDWWVVWDIPTGKKILSGKTHSAWAMDFSPDGKRLAVAGNFSEFYIYDEAGKVYWDLTLVGHGDTVLQQIEFARDGRHLVSSSDNGMLRVWDVQKKKAVALFCFKSDKGGYYNEYQEYLSAWRALAGDKPPDGVQTFAVFDEKPIDRLHQFSVRPDSKSVALAVGTPEVIDLDLTTGKIRRRFQTDHKFSTSVRFSDDGKLLAIGGGDDKVDTEKCTVEIWDVGTGKRLITCPGHNGSVRSMIFSPDGKVLFSIGGNDGVCAWDVATGKEKFRVHKGNDEYVIGLGILPDGKTLLAMPAKQGEPVRFLDAATGKRIAPQRGWAEALNAEPAASTKHQK